MATERILKYDGTTAHPCQEPLSLFKDIILPLGDIILDPFAGSGTTCVAAKQLGRKYIGIDISREYCNIAEQRLAQEELFCNTDAEDATKNSTATKENDSQNTAPELAIWPKDGD